MKPRNREINIFNLSMLDVICGSLGAFVIIMIILMPYYKKENIDYQHEIERLRRQAETSDQRASQAEQRAQRAEMMLAKTFLVVYIRWNTRYHDVDLHVIDPAGAEFYFQKKTIADRQGELSEDNQIGPGNEIWEIKDAPPGQYQLYANLYSRHGNPENPSVRGRVFFRDGSKALPEIVLTQEKRKERIGTLTVRDDGSLQFSW